MTMVRDGDVHRVPAVVDVCRADRPGRRGPDDDDDDRDVLFNNRTWGASPGRSTAPSRTTGLRL